MEKRTTTLKRNLYRKFCLFPKNPKRNRNVRTLEDKRRNSYLYLKTKYANRFQKISERKPNKNIFL
jgi:hypothetical protein